MSIWLFLKVFGDVCLYFSVISAFPSLFATEVTFLWPALICGFAVVVGAILSQQGHDRLRFAVLLLPLSVFLLAVKNMDWLVLSLPVLYTCVLIILNRNDMEYYSFRQFFKTTLIIWVIFFTVVWLFSYFEDTTQPWHNSMEFITPMICGGLYMLCGVMILRQLRMGNDGGGSVLNGALMGAVMGTIGISLLGLVALERYLLQNATSLLEILKKILIVIFTAPLTILTQLFSSAISGRIELLQEPVQEQQQYTEPPAEGGFPPPEMAQAVQQAEESGFPWWLVIVILLTMLLVLTALIGVLRRRDPAAESRKTVSVLRPAREADIGRDAGNRAKVRQIYRKFLRYLRGKGIKLKKQQTSLDILNAIPQPFDYKSAQRLREIYVATRYDLSRRISQQDVSEAREALRRIRSEK